MKAHSIYHAYQLIFGRAEANQVLFLERKSLNHSFRLKALSTYLQAQAQGSESGDKPELDLKVLKAAYKLLIDVMGERESALVMPAVYETDPAPAENALTPKPTAKAAGRRPTKAELKALPRLGPDADERQILGRFLHAQGYITLKQLIDAVKWQRAQRKQAGELAQQLGILTRWETVEVLRKRDPTEKFCSAAVRLGLMSGAERNAVLDRQTALQRRIGDYFVEKGILSREQIESLAESPLRAKTAA